MKQKANPSTELAQDEDHWRPDPFHEPRAWALAWDVTELLRKRATLAVFEAQGTGGRGLREETFADAV